MKFIILLSFMCAAVYAETQDEFIDNLRTVILKAGQECKTKTSATDDDIKAIKAFEAPETQTGKCFLGCMYKALKVLKDDATLNKPEIDKFVAQINEINPDIGAKIGGAIDACSAEIKQGGDICQVAHDGFACYQKEKKARGIPNMEY